jgi:hypothetical protein
MVCPICSSNSYEKIMAYKFNSKMFEGRDIRQCNDCSMRFIYPMPTQEEWDLYNASYFTNAHGGLHITPWIHAYNSGLAKVRLASLVDYIKSNNLSIKKILEIGPGPGYLMKEYLSRFPETQYYVVESDSSVHEKLNQLGATIIEPDEIETITDVDLLVATHVIEHTLKPVDFLSYFSTVLRRNGCLFIEVPCLDYQYKDIFEPHVAFFDMTTLATCFEKAGFYNFQFTYNGDTISKLRINSLIKKIIIKLQLKTKLPFRLFLGKHWPNKGRFYLDYNEALAISETSPHIIQNVKSRWIRGFGQKDT